MVSGFLFASLIKVSFPLQCQREAWYVTYSVPYLGNSYHHLENNYRKTYKKACKSSDSNTTPSDQKRLGRLIQAFLRKTEMVRRLALIIALRFEDDITSGPDGKWVCAWADRPRMVRIRCQVTPADLTFTMKMMLNKAAFNRSQPVEGILQLYSITPYPETYPIHDELMQAWTKSRNAANEAGLSHCPVVIVDFALREAHCVFALVISQKVIETAKKKEPLKGISGMTGEFEMPLRFEDLRQYVLYLVIRYTDPPNRYGLGR
jgi:hypothetical protein